MAAPGYTSRILDVNSIGNVRRIVDYHRRWNCRLDGAMGCWVFTGKSTNGNGYALVKAVPDLDPAHGSTAWLLHRLACVVGTGRSIRFEVSHLCGARLCFNPMHLVDEAHQTNEERKSCAGLLTCSRGHDLARLCSHTPLCIRPDRGILCCHDRPVETVDAEGLPLSDHTWQGFSDGPLSSGSLARPGPPPYIASGPAPQPPEALASSSAIEPAGSGPASLVMAAPAGPSTNPFVHPGVASARVGVRVPEAPAVQTRPVPFGVPTTSSAEGLSPLPSTPPEASGHDGGSSSAGPVLPSNRVQAPSDTVTSDSGWQVEEESDDLPSASSLPGRERAHPAFWGNTQDRAAADAHFVEEEMEDADYAAEVAKIRRKAEADDSSSSFAP